MELETRGCGGSGCQPVLMQVRWLYVLTAGVSQSVSQSARHRPRRTIAWIFLAFLSARIYTHTHAYNARSSTASTFLDVYNVSFLFLRRVARDHSILTCLFFGPVFPSRFRPLLPQIAKSDRASTRVPSVSVSRRISGPVEYTTAGHKSASTR